MVSIGVNVPYSVREKLEKLAKQDLLGNTMSAVAGYLLIESLERRGLIEVKNETKK